MERTCDLLSLYKCSYHMINLWINICQWRHGTYNFRDRLGAAESNISSEYCSSQNLATVDTPDVGVDAAVGVAVAVEAGDLCLLFPCICL